MDIDTLEAGRELDALIAERVMKWLRVETQYGAMLRHPDDGAIGIAPLFGATRGDLPDYSTDIKAAWEILAVIRTWDTQEQYNFAMRLRWAIEDRLQESVTDMRMIVYVEPIDICIAVLKSLPKTETSVGA